MLKGKSWNLEITFSNPQDERHRDVLYFVCLKTYEAIARAHLGRLANIAHSVEQFVEME